VLKLGSLVDGTPALHGATETRVLWDSSALYLAIRSENTDLWAEMTGRDQPLYKQDAVEFFLDADGDGRNYLELEWSPKGEVMDLALAEPFVEATPKLNLDGMEYAVGLQGTLSTEARDAAADKDLDTAWTVEVRLPWSELRYAVGLSSFGSSPEVSAALTAHDERLLPYPKAGTKLRANFYRAEYADRHPVRCEWSAWSPTGAVNAHMPEKFGVLVLIAPLSGVAVPAVGTPAPSQP
jgi:hypothetical protein